MLETSNALGFPILSVTLFVPLVAAIVIGLLPKAHDQLCLATGAFASGLALALAVVMLANYDASWAGLSTEAAFQFADPATTPAPWLPGGIAYHVGVDGMAVVLVFLTALLTFLALLYSFGSVRHRLREYTMALLVLETGVMGVFAALDLFLFYVFWEAALIPMMLLIGIWGGKGRIYATFKFVLYTMAGSALMLVAIVVLAQTAGDGSFHFFDIARGLAGPGLSSGWRLALFAAFAIAFAVKVPMFPLHTWLPDAHVEAPTAGSVVLAGVLLKMGTFGFVRYGLPLFPDAVRTAAPLLIGLALVGVWYGAWVAFAQPDIKSLVAYSSVSHMGLVMVGILALNGIGLAGGTLQMVNHGLTTGALFLLVGMLYDRAHTREIAAFGGLWRAMPRFSVLFLVVTLASIGLPGTNGFVGEWLALLGAFQARPLWGVLGVFGVLLGAIYMLTAVQRVFFGTQSALSAALPDLTPREVVVLLPLIVLILWIGVFPEPFLAPIESTSAAWIDYVNAAADGLAAAR